MSASTSTDPLPRSHQRGLEAESLVIQKLESQNYRVLEHRFRTPWGEADLLILSPKGGWVVIEVKSLGRLDWIERRISRRQQKRLRNLRSYLESYYGVEVALWAAFVLGSQILFQPLEA